jgi:hypothetical protein
MRTLCEERSWTVTAAAVFWATAAAEKASTAASNHQPPLEGPVRVWSAAAQREGAALKTAAAAAELAARQAGTAQEGWAGTAVGRQVGRVYLVVETVGWVGGVDLRPEE